MHSQQVQAGACAGGHLKRAPAVAIGSVCRWLIAWWWCLANESSERGAATEAAASQQREAPPTHAISQGRPLPSPRLTLGSHRAGVGRRASSEQPRWQQVDRRRRAASKTRVRLVLSRPAHVPRQSAGGGGGGGHQDDGDGDTLNGRSPAANKRMECECELLLTQTLFHSADLARRASEWLSHVRGTPSRFASRLMGLAS